MDGLMLILDDLSEVRDSLKHGVKLGRVDGGSDSRKVRCDTIRIGVGVGVHNEGRSLVNVSELVAFLRANMDSEGSPTESVEESRTDRK